MLVIRLSRHGRKNLPSYRVVLTEHTKPVKCGYKEVLWSYDPLQHIVKVDVDTVLAWIQKWARVTERVAKILLKETNNDVFKKFITHREKTAQPKKDAKN